MSDMEKKSSAANVEVGSAADVDEVLKKYDRESNTRIWEGKPKLVIRWLMVFFSLYSSYETDSSDEFPWDDSGDRIFEFPGEKGNSEGQPYAMV